MMKYKGIFLIALLAALAPLSIPVMNLTATPSPETQALLARIDEPHLKQAAPILAHKCMDCHVQNMPMPFYAQLPVAKDLIAEDVRHGLAHWDITGKLDHNGQGLTELDLARLEGVLHNQTMPPKIYVAAHWNAMLDAEDTRVLSDWIKALRTQRYQAIDGTAPEFAGEPVRPVTPLGNLDPAKVALGNRLFHDTRLSGDNTISCASCHALDKGGTDRARFSTGIGGQVGGINSPTVFNAVFHHKQFWDGRAADLVEQAHGPVANPIEMGSNWPQVIAKLQHDPAYVQAFNRLYPDGLTGDTIADAIATFEKSLVTPNAPFDRYLRGDRSALSEAQVRGYQVFKTQCASCHAGVNLGGLSFQRLKPKYFADRNQPITEADLGRFNVTQEARDKHRFKVPTLRNIAQTAPYLHDGSAETLEDVVKVMTHYQTHRRLSDQEIADVVSFLNSLTGEYQGQPVR